MEFMREKVLHNTSLPSVKNSFWRIVLQGAGNKNAKFVLMLSGIVVIPESIFLFGYPDHHNAERRNYRTKFLVELPEILLVPKITDLILA